MPYINVLLLNQHAVGRSPLLLADRVKRFHCLHQNNINTLYKIPGHPYTISSQSHTIILPL